MTRLQENILKMLESVLDVLNNNNALWAANIPFSNAVAELTNYITAIELQNVIQQTDTTGVTENKIMLRKRLEELTCRASGILFFYANLNNNTKLAGKVRLTKTRLARAKQYEIEGMSAQIIDEVQANAAAIIPFGWTAGMTTELNNVYALYNGTVNLPKAAEGEISDATREISRLLALAVNLLNSRIDKGMMLYAAGNSNFYTTYTNARKPIKTGYRKRALQILFKDAITGLALQKVNAVVDKKIKKQSFKKGSIYIGSLNEGSHSVSATLKGYKSTDVNFNIRKSQTTKLVIEMRTE